MSATPSPDDPEGDRMVSAMAEHGREAVAANWRCQGPSGTVCKQKGVTDRPGWALAPPVGCDGLTSVFRHGADHAVALWVIGTRRRRHHQSFKQKLPPQVVLFALIPINLPTTFRTARAPQILVFDLRTDALLWRYVIPEAQTKPGGLFTNIAVDVRAGRCDDAYAYASDVFRYGLVVYSWREDRSWRVESPLFFPDPLASKYDVHGVRFRWTDGVFGLALAPEDALGDRLLFFHPLSSFREFAVRTSAEAFAPLGEPRAAERGHASGAAVDRRGVLFYNLVSRDAVGCWNSRQPAGHRMDLQGIVAQDNVTLQFPNDLKVDQERRQSVWVLSNRLHEYLYRKLDPREVNFRILTAPVDAAVRGTVCDPDYVYAPARSNFASSGCDANY
ncbi:Protein yellow [Gryllus bimaculatus]|nr:Protein yellow [Gryllus bimaculatus]